MTKESGVSGRASIRLPIPDERISLKADLHFSGSLYGVPPSHALSTPLAAFVAFLATFSSYIVLTMGSRLI